MHVVFLGTGGSGAPPGRAENCILAEAGGVAVLLDAGPGCSQRLLEAGYTVCDISYVYISHLHLDHWSGLFDLAVQASEQACRPPALLAAGPVAAEAREVLLPRMPGSFREKARLEAVEPGGSLELGGLALEPVEARHTVPCYGALLREEGGAALYYSADTAPSRAVEEAAGKADLAAVEATMPSSLAEVAAATGHHTVEQALAHRRYMKPGSILALVHLTGSSLGELRERARRGKLPRGVLVPSDGLAARI